MIVVDVDSTAIATKTGTKGDKPWKMNLQQIAFSGHMVDGFPARLPRESTIQLDDEKPANRMVSVARCASLVIQAVVPNMLVLPSRQLRLFRRIRRRIAMGSV